MTAAPKIHHMYLSYEPRPGFKIEHISCGLHPVSARNRTSNTAAVDCQRCQRSSWFKSAVEMDRIRANGLATAQAERPAS